MGVQYQHLNREERVAIMLHLILESKLMCGSSNDADFDYHVRIKPGRARPTRRIPTLEMCRLPNGAHGTPYVEQREDGWGLWKVERGQGRLFFFFEISHGCRVCFNRLPSIKAALA